MAILPIKKYPDPLLRKKAKKVTRIRKRTLSLIANMIETMHENGGVGLAANQVGVLQRILVVDLNSTNGNNKKGGNQNNLMVLINPEILSYQGEEAAEEGCLSLPEITGQVKRAFWVKGSGLNIKGEVLEMDFTGLPARIFQHEIDHLNGVLFIDRTESQEKN